MIVTSSMTGVHTQVAVVTLYLPRELSHIRQVLSCSPEVKEIWTQNTIQTPTQCRDAPPGFFLPKWNFLFPNVLYSEN